MLLYISLYYNIILSHLNGLFRRKDDKDNGMVVAEVGLPCGFKADLSKTNAIGLDHKETSSDTVDALFKKCTLTCLLITFYSSRN